MALPLPRLCLAPRVTRYRLAAVLLCALTVPCGVRAWGLGRHAYWTDEVISVLSATGGPWTPPGTPFSAATVWEASRLTGVVRGCIAFDNGNAIVYLVTLFTWIKAFGATVFAARMLSVLAGVGVVASTACLARKLLGRRIAVITAVLAAIQPLLVSYSREVRSYALATLFVVLACVVLAAIVEPGPARQSSRAMVALYGVLTAAALLSHYLTLPVVASQIGGVLIVRPRLARRLSAALVLTAGLTSAWYVAAGREGLSTMRAASRTYAARAALDSRVEIFALPSSPRNLVTGFVQQLAPTAGNGLQAGGIRLHQIAPTLAIPGLLVAVLASVGVRSSPRRVMPFVVALSSLSCVVFATVLAVVTGHTISFQPCYGSFAAPFLTILVAWGIDLWTRQLGPRRWVGLGLAALHVGIGVVSVAFVLEDAPRYRPPDPFPGSAARLAALAGPGDTVIFPSTQAARLHNLFFNRRVPFQQTVAPSAHRFAEVRKRDGTTLFQPLPEDALR